ncbi:LPXTG cell wall anchor domain-containing protein [Vagococcus sp.]|uniref:LPXTG cell wall anchor domain-containing protein n=1 Tax=Vagococcus sp. TaxID=1933889 RepID=UPI003F9DCE69
MISEQQAADFLKQTEEATTKEELMKIHQEFMAFLEPEETNTSETVETTQTKETKETSQTKETSSTQTSPTTQTSDKKIETGKKLPQTGDNKSIVLPIIGGIIILIIIIILFKKRKNDTDVEDIE